MKTKGVWLHQSGQCNTDWPGVHRSGNWFNRIFPCWPKWTRYFAAGDGIFLPRLRSGEGGILNLPSSVCPSLCLKRATNFNLNAFVVLKKVLNTKLLPSILLYVRILLNRYVILHYTIPKPYDSVFGKRVLTYWENRGTPDYSHLNEFIVGIEKYCQCHFKTITFQCIYGFGMLQQGITGLFKHFWPEGKTAC